MSGEADKLPTLVQSLPQELYDTVYDLVFTAGDLHVIHANYQFPTLLHVSKASRQQFANSYYGGGSTFVFQDVSKWRFTRVASASDWDKITCVQIPYTEADKQTIRNNGGVHDDYRTNMMLYGTTMGYVEALEGMVAGFGYEWRCTWPNPEGPELTTCLSRACEHAVEKVKWDVSFFDEGVKFAKAEDGWFWEEDEHYVSEGWKSVSRWRSSGS